MEKHGDRFGRSLRNRTVQIWPVGVEPGDRSEAHEHYYEGRPFLDTVVFKIVAGSKLEERFIEFLKGNLEETIIPGGKTEEVPSIRSTIGMSDSANQRSTFSNRV